jgi:hypothetical protein
MRHRGAEANGRTQCKRAREQPHALSGKIDTAGLSDAFEPGHDIDAPAPTLLLQARICSGEAMYLRRHGSDHPGGAGFATANRVLGSVTVRL